MRGITSLQVYCQPGHSEGPVLFCFVFVQTRAASQTLRLSLLVSFTSKDIQISPFCRQMSIRLYLSVMKDLQRSANCSGRPGARLRSGGRHRAPAVQMPRLRRAAPRGVRRLGGCDWSKLRGLYERSDFIRSLPPMFSRLTTPLNHPWVLFY